MDYYCSSKFTDLQVHVQGRLLYNCCNALPERIDLDWLESNPGKLFHTNTMIDDRKLMLDNKSCESCHFGCYRYEEKGLSSKRLEIRNHKHIDDPMAPLKNLSISLATDCNLTCMYCDPEFSSSWYRDIEKNGEHKLDGITIKNDNWSKLWSKMKQNLRSDETRFFNLLVNEIAMADHIEELSFLGGEPLLHNGLEKIVDSLDNKKITIVSGLGVSDSRLINFLKKFRDRKITFVVSGESTGKFFELLRFGISWKEFQDRIKVIEDHGFEIELTSAMSNISTLDFINFFETFQDRYFIRTNSLTQRPFLMPHVLDDDSKEVFMRHADLYPNVRQIQELKKSIEMTPSGTDRSNLGRYLKEFSARRSIDLEFLPKSFRDWVGIDR